MYKKHKISQLSWVYSRNARLIWCLGGGDEEGREPSVTELLKEINKRASLVARWLRIRLPMKGTRV